MKDYILRRVIAAFVTDGTGAARAVDILDHLGVSLLSGLVPDVPEVIGSIPAISLTVGDSPVTVGLNTVFAGATSYETSALPSGVTISGETITVTPDAILAATEIAIRGRNAGGLSEPVTLSVTIAPAAPQMTAGASIGPAAGPVGTVHVITPATWSGTGPFSRAGELRQAGVVVATRNGSNISPFSFTSTATGLLAWSETISGPGGSGAATASATIANTAPSLAPAQILLSGEDLLFPAPAVTGGGPTPTVTMTSLTLDGVDVRDTLENGTLFGAATPTAETRVFVVTWTASNGTAPDAVRSATYTVEGVPQADWQVSGGENQLTISAVPTPATLQVAGGENSIIITGGA